MDNETGTSILDEVLGIVGAVFLGFILYGVWLVAKAIGRFLIKWYQGNKNGSRDQE